MSLGRERGGAEGSKFIRTSASLSITHNLETSKKKKSMKVHFSKYCDKNSTTGKYCSIAFI